MSHAPSIRAASRPFPWRAFVDEFSQIIAVALRILNPEGEALPLAVVSEYDQPPSGRDEPRSPNGSDTAAC